MIVLLAGLLAVAAPPSEPQADLSKLLVGKWAGNFVIPRGGQQQRVLVVESVHHRDGGWMATARFGPSDESLFPANATLEVSGSEVRLKFKVAGSNEANLVLRGDSELAGTFKIPTNQGLREVPMTLKKVQ